MGAIYLQWPEERRWNQVYLKLSHVLNQKTFYEITASYLQDKWIAPTATAESRIRSIPPR